MLSSYCYNVSHLWLTTSPTRLLPSNKYPVDYLYFPVSLRMLTADLIRRSGAKVFRSCLCVKISVNFLSIE